MNLLSLFQAHIWAITEEGLLVIQQILDNKSHSNITPELLKDFENRNKTVNECFFFSASSGGFISNSDETEEENLTAVIPIKGTMFKSANLLTSVSGARSMEMIQKDIHRANSNPKVGQILLNFDTPGGTVDGTLTTSRVVRDSKKPTLSFIDGKGASSGYWMASQAPYVMASGETDLIGSIGTVFTHTDNSGWMQISGRRETPVTATKSVDKVIAPPNAPLQADDIAKIRAMMDPINEVFINSVSTGRGSKIKDLSKVTTGKVFNGSDSLAEGLVDEIGSFNRALEKVAEMGQKDRKIILNNNNTNQNEANMSVKWKGIRSFFGLSDNDKLALSEAQLDQLEQRLNDSVPLAEHTQLQNDLHAALSSKTDLQTKLDAANNTITSKDGEIEKLKKEDAGNPTYTPRATDQETVDFSKQVANLSHNRAADSNPLINK